MGNTTTTTTSSTSSSPSPNNSSTIRRQTSNHVISNFSLNSPLPPPISNSNNNNSSATTTNRINSTSPSSFNNRNNGNMGNSNQVLMLPDTQSNNRRIDFDRILNENTDLDLIELRKLAWTGIPREFRAKVWQLMLGYLPTSRSRREEALRVKREDYLSALPKYWSRGHGGDESTSNSSNNNHHGGNHNNNNITSSSSSNNNGGNNNNSGGGGGGEQQQLLEEDQKNLRQILVDIPRTAPDLPLFHADEVRRSMERILYLYAIRHPASGYVQGMNDLLTPFYAVFLADRVCGGDLSIINSVDPSVCGSGLLDAIEADTYWCLTKLLDGIQDHYTSSQPGLQKMVFLLQAVVQRIDAPLHAHFEHLGLMYTHFAFRWMNCLLLREIQLPIIARLWDTYLSEERDGFTSFHVYVCAALLVSFSDELKRMNLEEIIIFLQDLPTRDWTEVRAESLLSQAYILQSLFHQSPAHLKVM
jgi:hypothetical protein